MSREIVIREAVAGDRVALAGLLAELGYPQSEAFVTRKLQHLSQSPLDRILVAAIGSEVVGFASLHVLPLMHEEGKLCRVTALVVSAESRRMGVARTLMESIEAIARSAGCVRVEVTSGDGREGADEFYGRVGYEEVSRRFVKRVS